MRWAWLRFPCNLGAKCEPLEQSDDTIFCTARVNDLSVRGVRLMVRYRLQPGALVSVAMWNRAETYRCVRTAQVAHANPLGDGAWSLGCEFTDPLDAEELERLLH